MKNLFLFTLMLIFMLISCGKKASKTVVESPYTLPAHLEHLIGTVGPGTAMHTLQLCQLGMKTDTVWIEINDSTNVEHANLVIGNLVEVLCQTEKDDNLVALKIVGNQTYADAIGSWTTPDPINPAKQMGVELDIDGVASSINMATLVYTSWQLTQNPGEIILHGKSIGNIQTIEFADTAKIYQKDGQLMLGFKGKDFNLVKQVD